MDLKAIQKRDKKILKIIDTYFPGGKINKYIIHDCELETNILAIKIHSSFSPEETAQREWDMLGKLVKIIPQDLTPYISIWADVK